MSIGITSDHVELAATLRKWVLAGGFVDQVRAAESDADQAFAPAWEAAHEMGLPGILVSETRGGGGGNAVDVAVVLEATAYGLLPGALLGNQVAAALFGDTDPAGRLASGDLRVALAPTAELSSDGTTLSGVVRAVLDLPGATHLLAGTADDAWYLIPTEALASSSGIGPDLSRRFGTAQLEQVPLTVCEPVPEITAAQVRRGLVTFAAAEASGVARWCLSTAVEYAGVREQFGRPIGSFQAIKHLCSEMLEKAEAITAVAWDAAAAWAAGDDEQWAFAVEVAGAVAFDAAVEIAQDCIQVLGGIGFTFEHEAHFRLRRATALRLLAGRGASYAAALAARAATGTRRTVTIDFDGADEAIRPAIRETAATIAAADGSARRAALVDSGYLVPHWPAPFGAGAGPVEQLVIDQELAAAGVSRPDIKIAGWAVPTIIAHGTDAQRERFVRPSLTGELVWCQLFSEPGAGSDLASLRMKAERVEGGWRLTGQKVWNSLAREADFGICLARTDPDAPQHRGITYFLVDMRSPGIDVRPLREMTGDELFNEVFLDGVLVPDEMVVGEVNGGWRLARTTLANERVAMAGHRLGASTEQAVALLAAGEAPGAEAAIGEQVALATIGMLLGVRGILRSLAGQGPGAESSVSKLLGVRARQEASALVVELLGDKVLTGHPDAAEAVHEALLTRCLSIAGGTTQVLRNVVGERILGLPR
ncbi:acyl-CoA dehydrogenase [Nocardioides daejeonensis]|uniref:acyl-CoA dehydrogenase n=1 Tax=Nocardioides daejeonensis TaxID=1046556 RepID=UPI000D74314B|nr:acyl-CoA dehydrogenase [Nocardioides daejeonensis]